MAEADYPPPADGAAGPSPSPLVAGQLVFHQKFGVCVVAQAERHGVVTLRDAAGGHREFVTHIPDVLVGLSAIPLPDTRSPATFAVLDAVSGWSPFSFLGDDAERAVTQLMRAATEALTLPTFGRRYDPPWAPPPPARSARWQLGWIDAKAGLGAVGLFCFETNQISIDQLLPFPPAGRLQRMKLHQVQVNPVMPDGVIDVSWGANLVQMADTGYADNAGWYCAQQPYWFRMSAVALACTAATVESWHAEAPVAPDLPDSLWEVQEFTTATMVALIPEPTLGPAMHAFRGKVVDITAHPVFDRPAWLIALAVAHDHAVPNRDEPLVLNMLVSESVWPATSPPAVGDFLQGVLWLQGRMHCPDRLPDHFLPPERRTVT